MQVHKVVNAGELYKKKILDDRVALLHLSTSSGRSSNCSLQLFETQVETHGLPCKQKPYGRRTGKWRQRAPLSLAASASVPASGNAVLKCGLLNDDILCSGAFVGGTSVPLNLNISERRLLQHRARARRCVALAASQDGEGPGRMDDNEGKGAGGLNEYHSRPKESDGKLPGREKEIASRSERNGSVKFSGPADNGSHQHVPEYPRMSAQTGSSDSSPVLERTAGAWPEAAADSLHHMKDPSRGVVGERDEDVAGGYSSEELGELDLDTDTVEEADSQSMKAHESLMVRILLLRTATSRLVARVLAMMLRRAAMFRDNLQQAAWSGEQKYRAEDAYTSRGVAVRSSGGAAVAGERGLGSTRSEEERRRAMEDDAAAAASPAVEEDLADIPWDLIKRIWNHPAFVKFRVSLSMANLTMALPTFLARALPLISSLHLQFLTPSHISLPILAPLLFGGGIVFKSVISNLGYVLPRLGMSIVILWVLWGANHIIQEAILRLRNHGVINRRVSNVLFLFVELTASAIAVVTVLSTIGVKISSLLVPFFVAIALAGKDVWHNYFAGFFLFAAQPFRPGDTVTMMCGNGGGGGGPPSMAPSSHVVLGPGSWFEGVCESVDLRYTVLRNGRHRLMVPNSHFLKREFLVTDTMTSIAPPSRQENNNRRKKIEREVQRQSGHVSRVSATHIQSVPQHDRTIAPSPPGTVPLSSFSSVMGADVLNDQGHEVDQVSEERPATGYPVCTVPPGRTIVPRMEAP